MKRQISNWWFDHSVLVWLCCWCSGLGLAALGEALSPWYPAVGLIMALGGIAFTIVTTAICAALELAA